MPQSYAYCLIFIGNCNHQTFSASIIVPHLDLKQIKSNLSVYSLYYAEVCTEFAGPISASLRPGNTAPLVEMSQRWRAVDKTVSDSTGRDLNLRLPASETNALPLDLLAGMLSNILRYCYTNKQ